MDDVQQTQPAASAPVAADTTMSSMNDVAGMIPPPAPVTPPPPDVPQAPAPAMPQGGDESVVPQVPASSSAPAGGEQEDDYSYAEDVLNEILDSLDRIEAKLEAIEKKQG